MYKATRLCYKVRSYTYYIYKRANIIEQAFIDHITTKHRPFPLYHLTKASFK